MKQFLPLWLACAGLSLLTSITASAGTITGRVFEDVNYGGGRGAAYATTGGFSPRPGARVEAYDANGNFLAFTTTDANGLYIFSFTIAKISGYIRVVSSSVTSSRGPATGLLPVVTYRATFGDSPSTRADDFDYVGGQNPGQADAGESTTAVATTAQAYTFLANVNNADTYANVDFGFSFNVVTNTNDAGQGSLRQFIINANALSNTNLSQRQFDNNGTPAGPGFPAGQETSIFMLSDGTARPGLRAGLANQLTNAAGNSAATASRALITLASALPTLTDAATAIDGTTQTTLFDSNPAVLGTGGTVGTAATALGKLAGPEVELSTTSGNAFIIAADNCVVRGLALHGGNAGTLRANAGAGLLIESCGIGITAFDVLPPATNPTNDLGLFLGNLSGTVRNNVIANCGNSGINYSGAAAAGSGYLITGNEFQQNGRTQAGGDNITVADQSGGGNTGPAIISHNLISFANSSGIQFEVGHLSNNTVTGNTIINNGKGGTNSRLEGSGIHYLQRNNPAINLVLSTNADVISNNIIAVNQSSAVVINYGQRKVHVTQNSIYGNGDGTTGGQGLIAVDFTPIDYYVGGNKAYGQGDGVTPNDGTLDANKANGGMNYPIITKKNVTVNGNGTTTLHVEGFVGRRAGQPEFAGTEIEFYRGDNTSDSNQDGEIIAGDNNKFPHGEPRTYIGTITTGSTGSFNADITVPTNSVSPELQTTDPINSLAYLANYGTSEAGINLIPNTLPGPLPVTLTHFEAQASGPGVLLTWATATELRNDYFEVQRSFNGQDFEVLGRVAGNGTTGKPQTYAYPDQAARPAGATYYRLRQVDTDGTGTYSPVRVVRPAAPATLLAYPNPTADYTSLDLSALPNGEYQLIVADLLGKVVATQPAQGGQVATLDLRALAAGTYLVRLAGSPAALRWQVARN